MKLLILSDLHSNAEGVRAILQKEGGADAIYAAGDFVDYGTDPAGTIAWVRANGVRCVRGNHDDRLISVYRPAATPACRRSAAPGCTTTASAWRRPT